MKIIIIDKVHNFLPETLINAGFEVHKKQNLKKEEIIKILPKYEGIIIRSKIKLSKKVLSQLPDLKFIARVGAGMESIDYNYAIKKGIKLFNAPEGNRDSVAEQAVGMILSLLNNICNANSEVKKGLWNREKNRGEEIKGKTIGIIGYGNTGSSFARRLKSFDVNVISYDKYKKNYTDCYTKEVSINDIFEYSDILSLNVPLQDETYYMVDDNFISKFKKNFYIINTSRGKVIKTSDLIKNLKSGKIKGAALDVLEFEKISFEELSDKNNKQINYLQKSENVLLTPHIAGLTDQSNKKLAMVTAEKIKSWYKNF